MKTALTSGGKGEKKKKGREREEPPTPLLTKGGERVSSHLINMLVRGGEKKKILGSEHH